VHEREKERERERERKKERERSELPSIVVQSGFGAWVAQVLLKPNLNNSWASASYI
jgi:hypothetical protein